MTTHNTREGIEEIAWQDRFDAAIEAPNTDGGFIYDLGEDYQSVDFDTDAIKDFIHQELQKAREEKQNILTVGWHKGEMDFGINCDIDELDIKQMHEFRVMVCVAIGQAENMWRRAREKQNPAAVNNLSDQSELDQPIS